jgi:hypothetical protein
MIKFSHYHLFNGNILTVASELNKTNLILKTHYSIFNKADKTYIKKTGNEIAKVRLEEKPIIIKLKSEFEVKHEFLTWISVVEVYKNIRFKLNTSKKTEDSIKKLSLQLFYNMVYSDLRNTNNSYDNFIDRIN